MVGPFSVRDGEDNYQLYLIRPASSSQSDFINLLFDRPLLLLIVTMLVSSPLLLWLAWSLAKPARKLKNAADEVAQGNLRQHPELEAGPQEFLAAGASFNQMVTALERMMTSQQRLLSDISHELRTPLTRLQLGTALLRRRGGESKELERIETEAQRLDSMINDLLVMSRNQQKNALVSETMKANQLWGEVLDNAAFEAEQMGKSLTVNYPPGPWPLYGNPNALESALENIVRNALRYSHTKIEVGFSVDKDGITITVDDDGPGVSPEDREQIFRPFYRTDEARDRESGGTGLGLAIVESAMQQHRGWVKADDSPSRRVAAYAVATAVQANLKTIGLRMQADFLSRRRDLPGNVRRQNPLGAVIPHVHPGNFAIAHFEAVDKAVIGKRATVGPFAIQRTVGINHNVIIMLHRIKLAQRLLHPLVASAVKLRDICRARHCPASGEGNFHLRVHIRCGAFSIGNHRGHQKFFYDRHRIFSFSHNPSFHFGGVLSPHSRLALSSILPLKRRFCMVRLQLADSPAALNSR